MNGAHEDMAENKQKMMHLLEHAKGSAAGLHAWLHNWDFRRSLKNLDRGGRSAMSNPLSLHAVVDARDLAERSSQ